MRGWLMALVSAAVSLLLVGCATVGAVRCEYLPDGSWLCGGKPPAQQFRQANG